MTDRPPLKTVERALEVVEVLWKHDGASVSEISDELGIPKSTVHDYLRTLRVTGFAINVNGSYRLSTKFLQIGGRLKYRMKAYHAARPELERVAKETGEIANLTIAEDGQAVILHNERGENALKLGVYPGIHTPIHSHAAGKAILSTFSDERISQIIEQHGLPVMTEKTITSADTLFAEIDTIREKGFAHDFGEQVSGMGVVAVPVQDLSEISAALAIVCPTHRLKNDAYVNELAEIAEQAAQVVSINATYGS